MSNRVQTFCGQCGATDDHPKVHLGEDTKHHDCLSFAEDQALRAAGQSKDSGPKASAVIDACKSGVRGYDLLALIQSGELPQAEGLHEQEK